MLLFQSGAGAGIGQGTAYMFAKAGAKMVVTDQNESNLKETAKKCEELSKQKVWPYVMRLHGNTCSYPA